MKQSLHTLIFIKIDWVGKLIHIQNAAREYQGTEL